VGSDVSLAVVNGTGDRGLANRVSKMLEKPGYDVVVTPRVGEDYEKTRVIVDKSVEVSDEFWVPLSHLIPYKVERSSGVIDKFRAGVVVLLGKDYLQRFEGK